jgi:ribosomal protein S18 acetylase RimI-like enzyme
VIRRINAEDWELVREVRLRALREDPDAFLATHAQESAFPDEQWQARAAQANGATFIAAGADGAEGLATGFVDADPTTVFLVGMWVAPALRGSGTAQELVEHVVEWARARGSERVSLSVEGQNLRAARLYERCGFTETKEPPNLPYEPNAGNRFFVLEL